MEKEKLERISFLSRKSRETELTQEELAEQQQLRREYIDSMKQNLRETLDSTVIVDKDGNKTQVSSRKRSPKQ